MSYLVAAYGVTVVALVGYGLALHRERRRRTRDDRAPARTPGDPARHPRDGS